MLVLLLAVFRAAGTTIGAARGDGLVAGQLAEAVEGRHVVAAQRHVGELGAVDVPDADRPRERSARR